MEVDIEDPYTLFNQFDIEASFFCIYRHNIQTFMSFLILNAPGVWGS